VSQAGGIRSKRGENCFEEQTRQAHGGEARTTRGSGAAVTSRLETGAPRRISTSEGNTNHMGRCHVREWNRNADRAPRRIVASKKISVSCDTMANSGVIDRGIDDARNKAMVCSTRRRCYHRVPTVLPRIWDDHTRLAGGHVLVDNMEIKCAASQDG
jgi:hypothetical protein